MEHKLTWGASIPLVRVSDKNNKPVEGVIVHITDMENKRLIFSGVTNEAGESHG